MNIAAATDIYAINDIEIGTRFRKDLSDVTDLMASIEEVGLLQPVVITPDGKLVAGARRIEAVKRLGWEEVPVRVAESLEGAAELLIAERDENTQRLDMKPSELVALGMRLEEIVKPEADERRLANLKQGRSEPGHHSGEPRGETRAIVGRGLGISGHGYQRAKAVVREAESGDPEVRKVARAALEEMDRTGKIKPAYESLRRAKLNQPEPGEFAGWDKSSQRYKDKTAKIIEGIWSSLNRFDVAAPGLAKADMEILVENLSPAELEGMYEMAANAIKGLKTFQRRLKEHKPETKESE